MIWQSGNDTHCWNVNSNNKTTATRSKGSGYGCNIIYCNQSFNSIDDKKVLIQLEIKKRKHNSNLKIGIFSDSNDNSTKERSFDDDVKIEDNNNDNNNSVCYCLNGLNGQQISHNNTHEYQQEKQKDKLTFNTGDKVEIIVDFDELTMSYAINDDTGHKMSKTFGKLNPIDFKYRNFRLGVESHCAGDKVRIISCKVTKRSEKNKLKQRLQQRDGVIDNLGKIIHQREEQNRKYELRRYFLYI